MDPTLKQFDKGTPTPNDVSQPLISVALSVYNGGESLRYAIQSVINQTYPDWELLVLDDGSSDGSIELVQQFSDPRIRLIRDGHNRGLAARLNQAIDLARGHYFARMDHDDICHPERFERQVQYLKAHADIDLLCTECVTIDEDAELLGRYPAATDHDAICRRPWLGFYMPHPTWMGKLSWFRQHRYASPGPYCSEDQELLLRTHTISHFHTYPQTLLAYRLRRHTPWNKLWRTRWTLCRLQIQYFQGHKQWAYAGLSAAAAVLRLSLDALRKLQRCVRPPAKPNPSHALGIDLTQAWQQQIQDTITKANGQGTREVAHRE